MVQSKDDQAVGKEEVTWGLWIMPDDGGGRGDDAGTQRRGTRDVGGMCFEMQDEMAAISALGERLSPVRFLHFWVL
ncbi:hypothetical protein Ct61P_08364 [Colletotrichum tofieldiae]|nr:hypothetical protein Ct61P_08364 [Colletotrichum tofieldiae]